MKLKLIFLLFLLTILATPVFAYIDGFPSSHIARDDKQDFNFRESGRV